MLSRERKPDTERTALARDTFSGDAATELLHQRLCNGKPQPGALARAGAICAIKALEDVRQVSRLDTYTRVANAQHYLPISSLQRDDHTASAIFSIARSVLERIVKQDQRNASQVFLISIHSHRLNVTDLQFQRRSRGCESPPQLAHQLQDGAIQFHQMHPLGVLYCQRSHLLM